MTMIYDLVTDVQLEQAERAEMYTDLGAKSKVVPCPECGELIDVMVVQILGTKYRKCFACKHTWQTKANMRDSTCSSDK